MTDRGFSWRSVYRVETGSGMYGELGPFRLWARRETRDWCVSFDRGKDQLAPIAFVEHPSDREPAGDFTSRKFGFLEPPAELRLTPALAERPVVVSLDEPFLLPPKEETTMFVSTPVWVRVAVGEPAVELAEEPSHRPSDTWFGGSTREGELCYAIRTPATLENPEPALCAHLALSVVNIRNRAGSVLEVEKVKLPTQNMSLFIASDGHLWTEEVRLTREQDDEVASVVLAPSPPAVAVGAERLAGPRRKMDRGFLDRAFSGIIRELRG